MEYVAAAESAYSLAREVYYGSRWLYQTVQSAGRKHSELETMREEFREEFQTLFTFCHNFLRNPNDPVMASAAFQALLPRAVKILKNLQSLYASEAAMLAFDEDQEYAGFRRQQISFLRHGTRFVISDPDAPWLLEVPLTLTSTQLVTAGPSSVAIAEFQDLSITRPPAPTTMSISTTIQPATKRTFDLRWALLDKPRLQSVLRKVKIETGKLQLLTPQFLATTVTYYQRHNTQALDQIIRDFVQQGQAAGHLGVRSHMAIREIASEAETLPSSPTDSEPAGFDFTPKLESLDLGPDCILEPQKAVALTQGSLTRIGKSPSPVLVEYKKWRMTNAKDHKMETESEIHRLARVLATAGTLHLSTLGFCGFIEQEQYNRYAFVFEYPKEAGIEQPITLNYILGKPSAGKALTFRLKMAQILAESLGAFHSDGWVHKSICSQSVVFFNGHNSKPMFRKPYLVNFEYARPATSDTVYAANEDPARRVYVHPERQPGSSTKFNTEHELYSLGVVLLEIGLWKRAIDIRNESVGEIFNDRMAQSKEVQSKYSDSTKNADNMNEEEVDEDGDDDSEAQTDDWQSAEDGDECRSIDTTPDDTLQATSGPQEEGCRAEAEATKEAFINAAKTELPDLMGPCYAEAVQACLSAEFAANLTQVKMGIPVIREVTDLLNPDHLKLED